MVDEEGEDGEPEGFVRLKFGEEGLRHYCRQHVAATEGANLSIAERGDDSKVIGSQQEVVGGAMGYRHGEADRLQFAATSEVDEPLPIALRRLRQAGQPGR